MKTTKKSSKIDKQLKMPEPPPVSECFRCDGTKRICNICGESERACGCDSAEIQAHLERGLTSGQFDPVMTSAHPMTAMINSKLVEESALNQAQLLLERCVESSGVSRRELQRRAGMSVDIPQILCNNFTVKTMAKLLFACGYEVRFSISKIETKAAETADKKGVGE
jgi:hypothetical protein